MTGIIFIENEGYEFDKVEDFFYVVKKLLSYENNKGIVYVSKTKSYKVKSPKQLMHVLERANVGSRLVVEIFW